SLVGRTAAPPWESWRQIAALATICRQDSQRRRGSPITLFELGKGVKSTALPLEGRKSPRSTCGLGPRTPKRGPGFRASASEPAGPNGPRRERRSAADAARDR